MALNAKNVAKSGGSFIEKNPLEAQLYPARVVQVIDLGLQPQRAYKGEEKPPAHTIRMTYELSHEFMPNDAGEPDVTKPRWISEEFPFYSLEADRATSTKRYKAIDPSTSVGGEFTELPAMPCQVMITKSPDNKNEGCFKNYVGDVSSAATMPGYVQPELVNPTTVFTLDEPNMEVYAKLPPWLQEKIKSNLEYAGSPLAVLLGDATGEAPKPQAAPAPQAPAPVVPNPVPIAPPKPPSV